MGLQKEFQHSTGFDLSVREMEREIRLEFYIVGAVLGIWLALFTSWSLLNWQHMELRENLRRIYSYLKDWKQWVRVINTYGAYDDIIYVVPQYYILGYISFNISINDIFFFIQKASIHNFADDNILSPWGETVSKWIDTWESRLPGKKQFLNESAHWSNMNLW